MPTIRQDFGADTAVTITLTSLANGASATSSAIDVGDPGPFALALEVLLTGLAGGTGICEIYVQFSNDNSDFSDDNNDLLVGIVNMDQASQVKKVFSVPIHARYVQIRVFNNSSAALAASGHGVRYVPISVDQTT